MHRLNSEAKDILTWAESYERQTQTPLGSGALLRAIFLSDNAAQRYLRDQEVRPELLIHHLPVGEEPSEVLQTVWQTAASLAEGEREPIVTALHLLAGLLRYHPDSQALAGMRAARYDAARLRSNLIGQITHERRFVRIAEGLEPAFALEGGQDHELARASAQGASWQRPALYSAPTADPAWLGAGPAGAPTRALPTLPAPPPAPPAPPTPQEEPDPFRFNPYLAPPAPPAPPEPPPQLVPPQGFVGRRGPWTERPVEPPRPVVSSPRPSVRPAEPPARPVNPTQPPPGPAPSGREAHNKPPIFKAEPPRPASKPAPAPPLAQPSKPAPAPLGAQPSKPAPAPLGAQPSKPASSPLGTQPSKPASSPGSSPAPSKAAPGLGMLAPKGGQGAGRPPAAPENKLAEKVKGRFGSRKPGSAPAELAPPSLKSLAKDLFSNGAPQRAFPEPEREEPEVEPAPHRPPPEIIPEGGVEGVDVAPIPILQQERPAKASEQIARVMPKKFSKAELRRLEELYTLSDKKYPTLLKLGRNLSLEALQGRFDGLIGRGSEVSQLIDILNKRRSNNPLLVGPPGVGKTAIVEGLALALVGAQGEASGLGDRVLVELEMGRLLSGTQLRGSFAERLNAIKDEVLKAEGKIVIFLDELHTWIGAGASGDGGADAAGELKAALARGRFPCIGATTLDEYKKYIEGDPAFRRRFQVVEVSEPSDEVAIEILRGVLSAYEVHHKVRYDDEAVTAAVQLSRRYIPDQRLPDKAIGLLDLAGSRARRTERAAVDRVVVAEVVSEQTGVPLDKLLMKDRDRFLRMEEQLATSLIGHRGVIRRVCQVIRRNYAGFQSGRPIGSFLFLGPTGVGKTELVKVLADFLFRDRNAIVRLDMSEFREVHAVSRLIGAPPGYVGYDQGGQLTEAVRRRPYQIILLDEVEKAHPEVLNVLLQLLDDGRLTDGRGRTVDFSNTVVIMTSNLGSELFSESLQEVMRKARIGFARGDAREVAVGDEAAPQVIAQARASLSPELWNRIEERLVFGPLSREEVMQIARLQFQDSARRLAAERDIYMEADDSLYPLLVDQGGYDPRLGARPMRQTLQRLVEAQVSEMILQGRVNAGDTLVIRAEDGALRFAVADR